VSAAITLLSLGCNLAAGYAFARLDFPGRRVLFRGVLAALAIPAQVTMLPLFLELKALGWVNSYAGVVVPALASAFGIYLVRQFARAVPVELIEAARIDGAGEWRIFVAIVLPLLKPAMATLAVLTFLAAWNDFMWPLIVLTGQEHYTLPVGLASLAREHAQDTELMMAGSAVTVLPALALFMALQRHYLAGLLLGSR
jgi:multiple sugar transport system permease protein